MRLSQKEEIFFQLFFAFLKFTLILNAFQKKKSLIADLFLKLRTPKKVFK